MLCPSREGDPRAGYEPGQCSKWTPQAPEGGRSLLSMSSLSYRPAVLLITGLAWTVLETATATGTSRARVAALELGKKAAWGREGRTGEGPAGNGVMS